MNKKDKIKEAIINLQEYIANDSLYNGELKVESDFDKFCFNHCKDIDTLLEIIPKRYKEG